MTGIVRIIYRGGMQRRLYKKNQGWLTAPDIETQR